MPKFSPLNNLRPASNGNNNSSLFGNVAKDKMTTRTTYYYILYVDVVDSSKNELDLNHQVFKLNTFNTILREILHPSIAYDFTKKWSVGYNASTGDGAVFCFRDPTDPFVLSIMLHTHLDKYNENKSND